MNYKDISKRYNNNNRCVDVLKNVDIDINQGEIILINGSSGIGKSTLLSIIGCLIKPDSGSLKHMRYNFDLTLDDVEKFRINHFSYVFQNYNLLPEFTVYENLLIPALINKLDVSETENKISSLLSYMNIESLKYSYPDNISQGEKQRVALLRALVSGQHYIIADEPTGNLDEINTKIILDLIVNINKDFKKTFIIASHDNEFFKISNKIYLIKNGKLIEK